jgi:hypothetical protein
MISRAEETEALAGIRRILLIGMVGTAAELLFQQHVEEPNQLIPLVLIGVALLALLSRLLQRGPGSLRILQITMVFFIGAAFVGMYLHYGANVEFQLEMDPSLAGLDLFWKAMAAKTPPALAPGSMLLLGLIGLAYTYRHPDVSGGPERRSDDEESVT